MEIITEEILNDILMEGIEEEYRYFELQELLSEIRV